MISQSQTQQDQTDGMFRDIVGFCILLWHLSPGTGKPLESRAKENVTYLKIGYPVYYSMDCLSLLLYPVSLVVSIKELVLTSLGIKPNNVVLNQLFGGFTGLSLIPITFDWT